MIILNESFAISSFQNKTLRVRITTGNTVQIPPTLKQFYGFFYHFSPVIQSNFFWHSVRQGD